MGDECHKILEFPSTIRKEKSSRKGGKDYYRYYIPIPHNIGELLEQKGLLNKPLRIILAEIKVD